MIFFESWSELGRIGASALVLYAFMIIAVRLVGKRSTSQMNNFDWVVTVAVGSILASGILLRDVTIADAVFAVGILFGAQYLVTWAASRWRPVSRIVRARPRLLLRHGECLEEALKEERVTKEELQAAVRGAGIRDLSDVAWVVLETDASLSVIPGGPGPASALDSVEGDPQVRASAGSGTEPASESSKGAVENN